MCQERGKTWEGSDPQCAFVGGVFTWENWNCATMNALRELVHRDEPWRWEWRDDGSAASFGSIYVPETGSENGGGFYIAMSWYKSRGKTANAYRFSDDDTPRPITLADAMDAIESYAAASRPGARGGREG